MADEVYTSDGAPRETTIIHETRSSGGAGWVIAVVLIIASSPGSGSSPRATAARSLGTMP